MGINNNVGRQLSDTSHNVADVGDQSGSNLTTGIISLYVSTSKRRYLRIIQKKGTRPSFGGHEIYTFFSELVLTRRPRSITSVLKSPIFGVVSEPDDVASRDSKATFGAEKFVVC